MRERRETVIYDQERDKGVARVTMSEPLWVRGVTVFGRRYYLGRAR